MARRIVQASPRGGGGLRGGVSLPEPSRSAAPFVSPTRRTESEVPFGIGQTAALAPQFAACARRSDQAAHDGAESGAEGEQRPWNSLHSTIAGVVTRKKRLDHSRYMILAAIALMDVGSGRIATNLVFTTAPTRPLEVWLIYYWGTALLLIAMLAWDLIRHRRVMRSTLLEVALLWSGEALASQLYFMPGWQTAMAKLVQTWGWTG